MFPENMAGIWLQGRWVSFQSEGGICLAGLSHANFMKAERKTVRESKTEREKKSANVNK